jgi:hypothetical protein
MALLRSAVATAAAALAVVACGSTTTAPSSATTTPTPAATSSGPTGPPNAHVTLTGDPSLTGAMTIDTIECSDPSLSGEQIFVAGSPAASPSTSMHLTLAAGTVAIVLDTGSGSSFHARQFSGTGITGFDAAKGAQLSGPVTDTTPATSNTAGIGTLRSVAGTIDCAGQTPGSSTITISGTDSLGTVSGGITSVHVICLSTGEVETFGLTQVAGAPASVIIFQFPGRFTMDFISAGGAAQFFTATGVSVTTTSTGATVNGDATQSVAAGATPSTLHVAGQSTCGSAITP